MASLRDEYRFVEISDEEQAHELEVYGGLADSVRVLADRTVRTTVEDAEVARARALVEEASAILGADLIPRSFGVEISGNSLVRNHGNAVVGMRNPIAPPLHVYRDDEGYSRAEFHLGAVYEGPPATVHGGVLSLILDQLLGHAGAAAGHPGMTGTLTVRYERNTPLGDCWASARLERAEGVKAFVVGHLGPAGEEASVRADGIFIVPRWARADLETRRQQQPPHYE